MKKPTAAAKGADNNKRLALLEAGVSSLAMCLTANDTAVPEGGDVFATATRAIKAGADAIARNSQLDAAAVEAGNTIAELRSQIVKLEEAATAADGTAAAETAPDHEAEISTLKARVAELENEVKELETDVEDAVSERNTLRNKLSGEGQPSAVPAADQETAAAVEPAIERERPESARDVGPAFGHLKADEIAAAIAAGAGFEIAFSNGEYELIEFGPIEVSGADLHRFATSQFAVAPTLHIKGTSTLEIIHGAGLLMEGVQISYCSFDPPIRIEKGQERAFNRALIFG